MNPWVEVILHRNYVIIAGQRLNRPSRISVMQWLDFWFDVKNMEKGQ